MAEVGLSTRPVGLRGPQWDHDLEPGPVRLRRLVDDVSAVGARIGPGDREPETGPIRSAARLRTALEAVEKAGEELAAHAFSAILDGETQVCVVPSGGHRHRRLAVPQCVRDKVREHTIQRRRVDQGLEIRRYGDGHRVRATAYLRTDELVDPRVGDESTQELRRS